MAFFLRRCRAQGTGREEASWGIGGGFREPWVSQECHRLARSAARADFFVAAGRQIRFVEAMTTTSDMIEHLRAVSAGLPDPRTGRRSYSLSDIVMSAFAPFYMQDGSFLAFQRKLEEAQNRSNCQTLFGIARIPTDNHIRAILDEIDPAGLEPVFMDTVGRLEAAGALTKFQALDERLMVAFDGTQYFNSTKIHCPHCLIKVHNRGKDDEWTEYYHTAMCATLVGQGHNLAVPLMPEFIANDEPGAGNGRSPNKQDCEINATKRWLAKHGETLARYRPIALADALSACQPMLQAFSEHGWSYIVTALPSDLKTLYDFIEGGELDTLAETKIVGRRKPIKEQHAYRWIEAVPIKNGKDALTVNWIEHTVRRPGKKPVVYAVVTDLPVKSGQQAKAIIAAGRSRWRVENEGFNVLKNRGYELEHNWGHGDNFCAMMLACLNLIALAFHTAADLLCAWWRAARTKLAVRVNFFNHMRVLTARFIFPSWTHLLDCLADSKRPLPLNSS